MANPNESFVIKSITRQEIAEDLNAYLEMHNAPQEVKPDDPRLTARICSEHATGLLDYPNHDLDETDNETILWELQAKTLEKMGITIQDDED